MDLFIAEVVDFPPTPTLTAVSAPTFRFMDLPPELRVKVYEELVVVGAVFFRVDAPTDLQRSFLHGIDSYPAPSLAILRVSKTLHKEAEAVYLGGNTFVLPPSWQYKRPFKVHATTRWIFSEAAKKEVKHLSVVVLGRYSNKDTLLMNQWIWDQEEKHSNESFDDMTRLERTELAHEISDFKLLDLRESFSLEISEFEKLRSIELDFASAYCSLGCCRFLELDWDAVMKHAQKFHIYGLRNMAEAKSMLDQIRASQVGQVTGPNERSVFMSVDDNAGAEESTT